MNEYKKRAIRQTAGIPRQRRTPRLHLRNTRWLRFKYSKLDRDLLINLAIYQTRRAYHCHDLNYYQQRRIKLLKARNRRLKNTLISVVPLAVVLSLMAAMSVVLLYS